MKATAAEIPRKVGRYLVEAEMGRGAMGIVYRGRDPRIDRPVALKTLSPAMAVDPETQRVIKERFLNEGRAAGRLNHSGIVAVYDADEDLQTGTAYLAMELVEGTNLHDLMAADGGLPPERLRHLLHEVAAALDHAHDRGVIHRDVKPANILITEDGHAKLTDFGIARLAHSTMTQAGQLIGSPAYMSPEQVRGEPVTRATDVFSLGVVAYEGLTGRRPFEGGSLASTTHAITSVDPKKPSEIRTTVRPSVDVVLNKALAKSPDARYPTAGALVQAIDAALEGRTELANTVGTTMVGRARRRSAFRPLATVGLGLLALACAAWLVLQLDKAAPTAETAASAPDPSSPPAAPPTLAGPLPPPAVTPDPAPPRSPAATERDRTEPAPPRAAAARPAPARPPVDASNAAAASRAAVRSPTQLSVELLTGLPGTLVVRADQRVVGRLEVSDLDRKDFKGKQRYTRAFSVPVHASTLEFTFLQHRRDPIAQKMDLRGRGGPATRASIEVGRFGGNLVVRLE